MKIMHDCPFTGGGSGLKLNLGGLEPLIPVAGTAAVSSRRIRAQFRSTRCRR